MCCPGLQEVSVDWEGEEWGQVCDRFGKEVFTLNQDRITSTALCLVQGQCLINFGSIINNELGEEQSIPQWSQMAGD